ncbi:glutamate mutase L [Ornithinimicrobium cavernae]|uniref:glutamate mutase L n=1 Tax=Ornithinimicrobium cavernae TaxID=2666047 RepID=UPI001F22F80F|nr:glutamate mutase L [Ornithinimicrobium cavernae]
MATAGLTLLCVDVGSTFTKAALLGPDGELRARAATPTTLDRDVLTGVRTLAEGFEAAGHDVPDLTERERVLLCSSAGGGLRLAVVGYERQVTAEAGHRVGLSAGAKVVHVAAGALRTADVAALRADRPDIVLLVGGTDGGNAEVLLHNARRLASSRVGAPIVVAGNREAREAVVAELERTGRAFVLADNVLPRIGVVEPASARFAIREVFLEHVIGGKRLSKGPLFGSLVRAATPDAVLTGVETLADASGSDVMVVDVGGATTDVYSVITPEGEDASLRKEVVAPLWHARTVEGDLGMRWNAPGILEAAEVEALPPQQRAALTEWVLRVHERPASLPGEGDPARAAAEQQLDLELARLAATTAARRHGRPAHPGGAPRPLHNVGHLLGSGGVLRHAQEGGADAVLRAVLADHGGGWRPPEDARPAVDTAYLVFAAGLLAADHPEVARRVAGQILDESVDAIGVDEEGRSVTLRVATGASIGLAEG